MNTSLKLLVLFVVVSMVSAGHRGDRRAWKKCKRIREWRDRHDCYAQIWKQFHDDHDNSDNDYDNDETSSTPIEVPANSATARTPEPTRQAAPRQACYEMNTEKTCYEKDSNGEEIFYYSYESEPRNRCSKCCYTNDDGFDKCYYTPEWRNNNSQRSPVSPRTFPTTTTTTPTPTTRKPSRNFWRFRDSESPRRSSRKFNVI